MTLQHEHTPSIKFCGLSHLSDIESANEIAPEYVGFILWDKSKRCITPELAKELRASLDSEIRTVGVFVDEDSQVVAQYVRDGAISVAQLHGLESNEYISELRDLLHVETSTTDGQRSYKVETSDENHRPQTVEIWKAIEVKSEADIKAANESFADFVLLDAGKGAGESFDWSLLAGMTRPFGLAGGLDAKTARKIQDHLEHPDLLRLLDVSSGIESGQFEDGRPLKDKDMMLAFAQAARNSTRDND